MQPVNGYSYNMEMFPLTGNHCDVDEYSGKHEMGQPDLTEESAPMVLSLLCSERTLPLRSFERIFIIVSYCS